MKYTLVCLFALLSLSTFASQSSYFDFNEETLNAEFETLNTLEDAVLHHPDMTTTQAVEMNLMTIAQSANLPKRSNGETFAFEWEGFLWGFLCCPVGLFTVAINKRKSYDNKISFWIGVSAYSVMSMIYYVALMSVGGSTM